jgi:hypothetical protein
LVESGRAGKKFRKNTEGGEGPEEGMFLWAANIWLEWIDVGSSCAPPNFNLNAEGALFWDTVRAPGSVGWHDCYGTFSLEKLGRMVHRVGTERD